MTTARKTPYIWVTWISPILVGADACEWKAWFKAHNQYIKIVGNMDFANWEMKHTEMMQETIKEIENSYEGKVEIYKEGEGAFNLVGKKTKAVLAGKPDLIVVPENEQPFILDCKTGNAKSEHKAQVLMYMYAIPKVLDQFAGINFAGQLKYPYDHYVDIPINDLDSRFTQQLLNTINRIAGDHPPSKVPSSNECNFCDISKEDCFERNDGETERKFTDDF